MTRFMRNRKDGNQAEIVAVLERAGFRVVDLSNAGGGIPDIAVYHPRLEIWKFLEIKEGKGKLRESQLKFAKRFPTHVARTPAEALYVMGLKTHEIDRLLGVTNA